MIITKKYLKQKYIVEKLSTIKIGKLLNFSNGYIGLLLRRYNIKRRWRKTKTGHASSYKTGKSIVRNRLLIWTDKRGYIPNARLMMENKLNRKLKPSEIVHHIDGNTLNDSENNLFITNRSHHRGLHNKIAKYGKGIKKSIK